MKILDEDLAFLANSSNDDLQVLVDYLTKDKKGNTRWTEELTSSQTYKLYYPNQLHVMWLDIAHELQKFGGNTILNMLRGHGVPYREILLDVCKKMKVNYNEKAKIEIIEDSLLRKVLVDAIEKMSPEDLKNLVDSANIKMANYNKEAMIVALQMAIRMGGFLPYQIAVIVANAVCRAILGRGLALAVNAGITRYLAIFAGPIGLIITGILTAIDVAGPAYRVTIPCCIQIAYMRRMMPLSDEQKSEVLGLPLFV